MLRYHITALTIIFLVLGYLAYNNPSASFRSSDNQWADSEVVFKGRQFDNAIVPEFESYKLQCSAPKAKLIRTTKQQWVDIFAWPSYFTNPKWRVPYGEPNEALGDYRMDCRR
jgi:hypothetical protein